MTLVARRTPGHTRGCTTWTWRVADGGKAYDVVVIGSPNVNPGYRLVDNKDYPEIADDFARTFEVLKSLPCDVFLGAHGGYYGMVEKYERAKKGAGTNPFVDPEGYRATSSRRRRRSATPWPRRVGRSRRRRRTRCRRSPGRGPPRATPAPSRRRWRRGGTVRPASRHP